MDKLQKIGAWMWNNKERIILALMVSVFAYRIYQVFNPPPPPTWARLPFPKTTMPDDPETRNELRLPENPPLRPPMDIPGTYVSFYERNPFWYYSGGSGSQTDQGVRPEDLNIQLLDIQEVAGRHRVRLRTLRTTRWYSEGEHFEEFELQEIDPDDQTVVVYSERYARSFTIQKQ